MDMTSHFGAVQFMPSDIFKNFLCIFLPYEGRNYIETMIVRGVLKQ